MNTQTLYKHLLDNLSTAVLLLDADLCLKYINPAAEMLFAISSRRVQGENLRSLLRETPEAFDVLEDALESRHPFTKREAHLWLYTGKELVADYSVTPLLEPTDGVLLVEIQPRDRLIRISRDGAARSKQETTRELIRGLAHEIKNPLGGIRGAAQLLDRELREENLHDYTRVIIDEADRLQNLVDRMLGPRRLPTLKSINLHRVMERVYNLIFAESDGAITLIRDYDPSIPDLDADEEQLIQAMLNIVRNAVQALNESKTPNPTIRMRTRSLRQFTLGAERHRLVACITVTDNGPGIPESLRENLFYPMISGRAEGTGLGLSIAQSIVHQHNGLVECHSVAGCTEFMIFIPLEHEHDNDE